MTTASLWMILQARKPAERRIHKTDIKPVNYLSREFPNQIGAILARRKSDSTFDGICSDFNEIAGDIEKAVSNGVTPLPKKLGDLTDTLRALREEIDNYLVK
jgi:hypothetical protein